MIANHLTEPADSRIIIHTGRYSSVRMNIAVDDNLVTEALQLSKLKTKKELINAALREFIRNRKKLNLTEIKGKIVFREDYDYKKMRT